MNMFKFKWWSNPKVVGSIPTLVRVFLSPCVGPIPPVGLTLAWSMGRNLALNITLYHSICPKYNCYTANVCNKRNPSLHLNIFIVVQLTSSFPTTRSRLTLKLSRCCSGDQTRRSWVQFPPWSEFSSVLVWAHFHK